MVGAIVNVLVLAASIVLVTRVLPGLRCRNFGTAVMVALGMSVLNFVAFKLLFFLSLPFMLLTGFLGYFVINAAILHVVDLVIEDFEVESVGTLFAGSALISAVNWVLSHIVRW
jgi:putative membrane protein